MTDALIEAGAAGPTETDEAELPAEVGPSRTCIVTRTTYGKDALIRFVVAPDGMLVPDIRAKLPGRGAWVLADSATLAKALKRSSFGRAFKRDVRPPEDLLAMIDRLLEDDALQSLSLAKKAGLVTLGSAKIEAAIGAKPVRALVHATEAGQDGRRKLDSALFRRYGSGADHIARVQIFSADQLDLALGRTHVIHVLLTAGAAADGFISRSQRLERYRGHEPPSGAAEQP